MASAVSSFVTSIDRRHSQMPYIISKHITMPSDESISSSFSSTGRNWGKRQSSKYSIESISSMFREEGTRNIRPKWDSHTTFIITSIGYCVGIGNVWRFPYLCFEHGGGAFIIAFLVCLCILGLPVFFLEMMAGQFASVGALSVWEINPLFKGLGWCILLIAAHICIEYSVVIAIAVYYTFQSFSYDLPWSTCNNEWNSCLCRPITWPKHRINSISWFNHSRPDCKNLMIDDATRISPSYEFYYNKLLERTSSLMEPGGIKWDLTLCNFIVWMSVFFITIRGVISIGKVVYIFALFPYILMAAIFIKSISLKGSTVGMSYLMSLKWENLLSTEIWRQAASQTLFSLGIGVGSLMVLSSYNHFHDNCMRASIIISLVDSVSCIIGALMIFAILGWTSLMAKTNIADFAVSGPSLIFIVCPMALSEMSMPNVWSIMFFTMIVLFGMGSHYPLVEVIITSIQDEFPFLRTQWNSMIFRLTMCLSGFILGLMMTTRGGSYVFILFDSFIDYPLLFVGMLEVIALVPLYGIDRFAKDVHLMLGYSRTGITPFNIFVKWNLVSLTPAFFAWIIIQNITEFTPISDKEGFPYWAKYIGWALVCFELIWFPLWYIIGYCYNGAFQLLKDLNLPSAKWRPANKDLKVEESDADVSLADGEQTPADATGNDRFESDVDIADGRGVKAKGNNNPQGGQVPSKKTAQPSCREKKFQSF